MLISRGLNSLPGSCGDVSVFFLLRDRIKTYSNSNLKCPSTHKKHKESVHVDKSVKQFICDQCPFATHAQLYLNVHKRKDHVNKRQKEFLCDNCPKEFDLKGKVGNLEVESLLPFSAWLFPGV